MDSLSNGQSNMYKDYAEKSMTERESLLLVQAYRGGNSFKNSGQYKI